MFSLCLTEKIKGDPLHRVKEKTCSVLRGHGGGVTQAALRARACAPAPSANCLAPLRDRQLPETNPMSLRADAAPAFVYYDVLECVGKRY